MDNTVAGIDYLGNTSLSVSTSNGDNWTVSFQKASKILLEFDIVLKLKSGYYENTVFSKVRNNISEYLSSRIYGLGASVYSTELIPPILNTEGVDAVLNINLKRWEDAIYSDFITVAEDEIPDFREDLFNLSQE